jgi:hypothetical protein
MTPRWPYTKGAHRIADGVWAYLQPDGGWGRSNAGLVALSSAWRVGHADRRFWGAAVACPADVLLRLARVI